MPSVLGLAPEAASWGSRPCSAAGAPSHVFITTAITTWNYDACRGWLTSKTYADAKGPTYNYTPAGRLALRVWARGTNTVYSYSAAGDLSGISYSDGSPGISYTYDRLGRRLTATQNGMTSTLTYNDANLLLGEAYTGGVLANLSVTSGYDQHLRRNSLVVNNQQSTLQTISYGYDNASRLKTVTDNAAGTSATYDYAVNSPLVGNITYMQSGNPSMSTTIGYDNVNRLVAISSAPNVTPAVAPVRFVYSYNAANQRTNTLLADSSYWAYTYDSLGQVTSGKKYWSDGTPVAGQQFLYAFDGIGNRKSAASGGNQSGANLRTQTYAVNGLNQYTQRTVPGYVTALGSAKASATVTLWSADGSHAPTLRKGEYFRAELPVNNNNGPVWLALTNLAVLNNGLNADIMVATVGHEFLPNTNETFLPDLDGNLVQDGRWAYTWDAENRLVKMESLASAPAGSKLRLEFAYDTQGRRVWKRVTSLDTGGGVLLERKFVYDGWNLIAVLDAQSAVVRSFTWGLDLSGSLQGAGGVGGLLAVYDTSTLNGQPSTHFVAYDGNGNVAALVKATDGSMSAQYEYGPFGELLRATGPVAKANPFRFSTKYQDDETDLVMYPRRAYNPSTGRWLSRDPSADLSAQPAALPPVTYSDTELAEEDEPDGNTPPDLLAMVRPAYRFVDNNPIAHFDPLGEDIYLQRGNNMPTPNRWLHMSVCVDLWHCRNGGWQKTGKACFSFWATGLRFSFPSNRWLGWREFNAGGPLEGKIYQDPYVSGKVVGQLTTTAKQDTKWYMYMLVTRVGTADTYSLARHNCRRYSKNEFRDAPWNMGLP